MSSINRTAIVAAAGCLLTMQAMAQHMPPNSFLRKPVYSVRELIDQVNNDPVVLKHYLRHYAGSDVAVTSKESLIGYFSTLHTGKIMQTQMMKIYRVNKYGVIDATNQKIKAGTLAFFDPAGRPMLIRSCGNPTKYPMPEIPPKKPSMILMENPVPTEVTTGAKPTVVAPVPVPGAEITPPVAPAYTPQPKPVVERRRSIVPIPIPIPFGKSNKCPTIPGPAAAISFLGMAAAHKLRRRRKA